MIAKMNGWMPLLVSASIVMLAIIAAAALVAVKRLDTSSLTFVLGGALTWAGSQRTYSARSEAPQ